MTRGQPTGIMLSASFRDGWVPYVTNPIVDGDITPYLPLHGHAANVIDGNQDPVIADVFYGGRLLITARVVVKYNIVAALLSD